MRRRRYLAATGAILLAGCSGGDGGDDGTATDGDEAAAATDDDTTTGAGPVTTEGDGTGDERTDGTATVQPSFGERWSVRVPSTELARTDGLVVAGGEDSLTGVTADGSVAWEHTLDSEVDDVVATGGVTAVGLEGGGVRAFDARSGEELWSFTLVENERAPYHLATAGEYLARAAGLDQAMFRVVDAATGERTVEGTYDATAYGLAGVTESRFALGTAESTVLVDGRTRKTAWTSDVATTTGTFVAGSDVVVLGRGNGAVVLDAGDGNERWRYTDGYDFAPRQAGVDDGRVYLGSGAADRLTAVSRADGSAAWSYDIVGRATVPPVTIDDLVAATPHPDTLVLLAVANGNVVYEKGGFGVIRDASATDTTIAVGTEEAVTSLAVPR